jgi:hypothetical protein
MSTRAPTMLTSAVLANPQRELIAAHSVNHQADAVILNPHYDLSDEPPAGALARRRRRAGTVSNALDIRADREPAFELAQWVLRLPPTPPARLTAPAPQASARSSIAPVRPRPDGPLLWSFLAFTTFFCILLTRSVRTSRRPYFSLRFRVPWFVRLLEDKRLLNIADGVE